jgi:hypothetical protein
LSDVERRSSVSEAAVLVHGDKGRQLTKINGHAET